MVLWYCARGSAWAFDLHPFFYLMRVMFKNVQFKNNIKDACEMSDLIIVHTEWNEFKLLDLKKIVKKRNFIIYDMRNIYSAEKMKKQKIKYFGIGK